jgi:hypothetical protein
VRLLRDDATRWVWIIFGLIQATLTMLIAFDVLDNLDVPQAVTAVSLVLYVAVNELWAKPHRAHEPDSEAPQHSAWVEVPVPGKPGS